MIRRVVAWGGLAVFLVGLAVMILLARHLFKDLEGISFTAAIGAFPVVGVVIVSKRPDNALGWVFCLIGFLAGLASMAWSYSEYSYYVAAQPLPFALVIAWLGSWIWYPLMAIMLSLPLLLFPSGVLSPRWRPVLWAAIAVIVAVSFVTATPKTFLIGEDGGPSGHDMLRLENPVGLYEVDGAVEDTVVIQVGWFLLVGLMLAGVLSVVLRFRRSRGRERLQMKWFTLAAVVMGTNLTIGSIFPVFDESVISGVLFITAIAALPVTCGIAIVRHRLYEIDAIINRTLVYAVLTAILVLAYLGIVFVLQQLLTGITQDSDIVVAGSTLAVAAMFRPLRNRVQGFIDRRFYRHKYDAQQTLQGFSSRLREEVDLDHLSRDLAGVVRETMQPAHVSVWLRTVQE